MPNSEARCAWLEGLLFEIGRLAQKHLPETDDPEERVRRLGWDDPDTAITWVREALGEDAHQE